jgi:hypothetical protein
MIAPNHHLKGVHAATECFRRIVRIAPTYERSLVNLAAMLQNLVEANPDHEWAMDSDGGDGSGRDGGGSSAGSGANVTATGTDHSDDGEKPVSRALLILEEARALYLRVLTINPRSPLAKHGLHALSSLEPLNPPTAGVESGTSTTVYEHSVHLSFASDS